MQLHISLITFLAIAVIGTEDSYSKMFKNLRTAQRIGPVINSSCYCQNRNFFELLVKRLFTYQWFDEQIKPTPEIIQTLYNNTRGIVDQLVDLYMHIQMAYLGLNPRPTINEKFIDETFDKYFSEVRELLSDISDPYDQSELRKRLEAANSSLDFQISKLKEDEYAKELTEVMSNVDRLALQKKIIANVTAVNSSYTHDKISCALRKVMENFPLMEEIKATKAVLNELEKNETKTQPKCVAKDKRCLALSHEQMREALQ